MVRLGHGDPDTRDNATRPTVVRPVAYHADQFRRRALHLHLHLPAVETSGRTPRTAVAVLARWRGYVWRDCMHAGVLVTAIIRSSCHRRVIMKGRSTVEYVAKDDYAVYALMGVVRTTVVGLFFLQLTFFSYEPE